jgi:hypothetical protein
MVPYSGKVVVTKIVVESEVVGRTTSYESDYVLEVDERRVKKNVEL